MELKNAHLFKTGEHPGTNAKGLRFTERDLDGIVDAFNALGQSGRVPLRFGHSAESKPGAPALGWVSRIWRQGKDLFGDFADMPQVVFDAVRKGLYRFCSIELLKNAQRDGATYPFLLDGVALLGADPPAVDGLEDLQRLTLSRMQPRGDFEAALSFTLSLDPGDDAKDARIAALETRLARSEAERVGFARTQALQAATAHQQYVLDALERAVRERRILPRDRERLVRAKNLGDAASALAFTREDVVLYLDCHDQTPSIALLFESTARQPPAGAQMQADPPHETLAARARAIFAAKRAPDLFTALEMAVREEPAVMAAVLDHDLTTGWRGAGAY